MPIIIDGWNFIRNDRSPIDDTEIEALDASRCLVGFLERFQVRHGDPITVVFDSSSAHLGLGYKNNQSLAVVASKNADDYIKRYIDKIPERQRRSLRVVSSDKEVYFYAKSAYATPIKSEEFWKKVLS